MAVPGAILLSAVVATTAYNLVTATAKGVSNPVTQVHGWHRTFLIAHYLPALLWPLGLWVAILGYALRHRTYRDHAGRPARSGSHAQAAD